jgi:hypothetical protein
MHELIICRRRIKIIYGKINEIAGVYIRILCVFTNDFVEWFFIV